MMMVNGKQLSEAVVARAPSPAQEHLVDKRRREREIDAILLAAANVHEAGERWWYALRTIGCSEIALATQLGDSDVDTVVPIKSVPAARRSGSRSAKIIHKPVLKGLVFVRIVPSPDAFAGLLRVRGVAALIGRGERPHPIGDTEMNGFMDLAQAGAFDERHVPHGLKVGSRVRIRVGDMAEFEGVLEGYARGRTARVRTMLFGQEMITDVKLAHLSILE